MAHLTGLYVEGAGGAGQPLVETEALVSFCSCDLGELVI